MKNIFSAALSMSASSSLILLTIVAAVGVVLPQTADREGTILTNQKHAVTYVLTNDNLILTMEILDDFSDDTASKSKAVDFMGFEIDVNQNKLVDKNIDLAFARVAYESRICTQYLYDRQGSSGCGRYRSKASLDVNFRATEKEGRPHPVYKFTIPRNEILLGKNQLDMVFRFHSADKGYTYYPAKVNNPGYHSFVETIRVTF